MSQESRLVARFSKLKYKSFFWTFTSFKIVWRNIEMIEILSKSSISLCVKWNNVVLWSDCTYINFLNHDFISINISFTTVAMLLVWLNLIVWRRMEGILQDASRCVFFIPCQNSYHFGDLACMLINKRWILLLNLIENSECIISTRIYVVRKQFSLFSLIQ